MVLNASPKVVKKKKQRSITWCAVCHFDALWFVWVCVDVDVTAQTKLTNKNLPNPLTTHIHTSAPTCQWDGPGELGGDAQRCIADGLPEESEEHGPREGEEFGWFVVLWCGGGICIVSLCAGGDRTHTYVRGDAGRHTTPIINDQTKLSRT